MKVRVKFYLKRRDSIEPTAIYGRAYINKSPFKYYIGKSIYPALWDHEAHAPITDNKVIRPWKKKLPNIDIEIQNITSRCVRVAKLITSYIILKEGEEEAIVKKELREYLDDKLGVEKRQETTTLNKFIRQYIEDLEQGRRLTRDKKVFAPGTIKNYTAFEVQFKEYQDKRHKILDFDDITLDFYNDFVSYFLSKKYSPNSIGRLVKHLKVIMRAALDLKLHNNLEFERKDFRTIETAVDTIYLNDQELQKILHFDLSKDPKLELIRDVWMIGAFLGLRYSDYCRLRPEHVKEEDGDHFINILTKKTGERVIIPIGPDLKVLLDKYDNHLPKTHEQIVNREIKEIARSAKITDQVTIERIRGGVKRTISAPKCELISTHTARRSALTNMYLADIPPIDIMKISGHKTEKNFLKYIRVSKEETARKLAGHSHFKSKMKAV